MSSWLGLGRRGMGSDCLMDMEFLSAWWRCSKIDRVDGNTTMKDWKPWSMNFQWLNCMLCELYFSKVFTKKGRKENGSVSLKEFVFWTWWRNYCVSLFALTTKKFKAKRESDEVFRVFVCSLLPKFILFFFLRILPLYPSFLASVFRMWL